MGYALACVIITYEFRMTMSTYYSWAAHDDK